MDNKRQEQERIQFDQWIVNLDYAFNHGVDISNRVIRLTEDISEHHFDFFDTAMTILENISKQKITIKINSYGGDVYAALGIVARIKESPCYIHTKGYGKIMSASTVILAAGRKRSISKLAEFMHHEASYYVEGKHSDILHEVKQSQNLSDRWCTLMSELTGIPSTFWQTRGTGKDFYLTPEQCKNLKIVDEVF